MKNLLLFFFIFLSFITKAQIVEVEFDTHYCFKNETTSLDYTKVLNLDSIIIENTRIGNNKYVIDLSKKTIDHFIGCTLMRSSTIVSFESKDGLLFLTINDIDLNSNNPILIYFVINQGAKDSDYPYFTFYYKSSGIVNGYLALK